MKWKRWSLILATGCLLWACSGGGGGADGSSIGDDTVGIADGLGDPDAGSTDTAAVSDAGPDGTRIEDPASDAEGGDGQMAQDSGDSDAAMNPQDLESDAADDSGTVPDLGDDNDGDGIAPAEDNCPMDYNPGQENIDEDELGDVCDPDMDGDGLANEIDNCPEVFNPSTSDLDQDGLGDACDPDVDGDNITNEEDNCPDVYNPGQEDNDDDLSGDLCDSDDDNDGVQDEQDEAPLDPDWPGLAAEGIIYAHTSSKLFVWNPISNQVTPVGSFIWPSDGGGHQMTDIAIDYDGHLYGVTFDRFYRCSAASAHCNNLAILPSSFNGLTIVPEGTVYPDKEAVIGISTDGSWNRIDVVGNMATVTNLGSYGGSYSSSGDAYSIEGIGTFAAVNKSGASNDYLVKVNPINGAVLAEIGQISGFTSVFGLAGADDKAYAFDDGGAILQLDLGTGQSTQVLSPSSGQAWWGAAVTTRFVAE